MIAGKPIKIMLIGAIAPQLFNSVSPGCLPFGVMALSGYLKSQGIDCKVVSTAFPGAIEEIFADLDNIDLLGISSMSGPYLNYAISLSETIKKNKPNLPLVWGGSHASLLEEDLIINHLADYVIKGVGERALLKLIRAVNKEDSLAEVPGLIWLDKGVIKKNDQDKDFDINEFPQLDYSLVSERYPAMLKDEFSYFSSRGCPFNCSYCVASILYNRCWYDKSINKVISELKEAYERFKFNSVLFWDDNLFVNPERLINILTRLNNFGINFQWSGFCRADFFAKFDDKLIAELKKRGLKWVSFGAESGSQKMLDRLEKGIKVDDIKKTVLKLKKFSIASDFSFMGGMPGEKVSDFYETLNLVSWIKDIYPVSSVRVFRFIPYPKMPILSQNEETSKSLPTNTYEWSKVTYQTARFPWVPNKLYSALMVLSTASLYAEKPVGRSLKNFIILILYNISQLRLKSRLFFLPFESYFVNNLYNLLSINILRKFKYKLSKIRIQ